MSSQSFPARFEQAKQTIHNFDLPKINNFDFVRALLSVPLSYLLVILALGISVISGGLLIWLIYYLEATLFHRVHVGIIFMIAIGILTAIFVSARSIIASFISRRIIEISKRIDTNVQHAELMDTIHEVCTNLNTKMPDNVLLAFNPTFYVTEAAVDSLREVYHKRTLVIGLPYLRYLTKNEFKAIISHEMAHFIGKDTLFSQYVAPLYKNISRILNELNNYSGSRWAAIPMVPLRLILSVFYKAFVKLESKISRQREKRADYVAAVLYGREHIKNALLKVYNIGILFHERYEKDFWDQLNDPEKYINYFAVMDYYIQNGFVDINKLTKAEKTGAYDSHCTITERIEYLPRISPADDKEEYFSRKSFEQDEEELASIMSYVCVKQKTA